MSEVHVGSGQGELRGERLPALCVFRGIPFAAHTGGAGRFRPPGERPTWSGRRDATRFGPAPPQVQDPLSQLLGLAYDGEQGEDCLHLNVWTPACDDARRPVMVWLHGGAFATGTGAAPGYDGARLAARGDVVVVTLNYRVGALGFLHLAPRVGEGAAANVGLLDQIAALAWVRDEIAAFGGDPARVCVFGESAGAGSIVSLLAAPRARGLFRRAIIQSAAPDGMLRDDEGRERAASLLGKCGLQSEDGSLTLAAAQGLTVARLLDAQQACSMEGPHRTGMFFAPVVDGEVLPRRPLDAIAAGSAEGVEILIGSTAEEMRLYALVPGLGELSDSQLAASLVPRLRGDDAAAHAETLVAAYREALASRGNAPSQRELFFALETDANLRVPATMLAEAHAARGGRAFAYRFDWPSPMGDGQGGTLGACHALDVPFTFGALASPQARAFAGEGDAVRALSERMMDAWIAFARTGEPGHEGIGTWSPYDPSGRPTMLLGEKCGEVAAPDEALRALWDGRL